MTQTKTPTEKKMMGTTWMPDIERAVYEVYNGTDLHLQLLFNSDGMHTYDLLEGGADGESITDGKHGKYFSQREAEAAGKSAARDYWLSMIAGGIEAGNDYDKVLNNLKKEIARLAKEIMIHAKNNNSYRTNADCAIRQAEAMIAELHEQGLPII